MTSKELFDRARDVLVGGVNSPARAIDPYPPFLDRGEGARVTDVDGNAYIDLCLGFGPKIVGHAHPEVQAAVRDRIDRGVLSGGPVPEEVDLAERVVEAIPRVDKVRMVNSGTEATMLALRLARGITGRDGVVKVAGGYHGAHDALLVKAGSSATWHGVPDSAGVPADVAKHTSLVPYNDADAVRDALQAQDQACVIVEPILANAGLVPPEEGYLAALREACDETGTLLVFDEVVTGFRLGMGGAQAHFGVDADLVTLGKTLGGGFPVGAVAGPDEHMAHVTPEGKVFNAGTFNGHPATCTAGLATLDALEGKHGRLEKLGERLGLGLAEIAGDRATTWRSSMACLFFTDGPVRDYDDARTCDREAFWDFHAAMLERGVYLPPGQFETWFLSTAHTAEDIDRVLEAAKEALGP